MFFCTLASSSSGNCTVVSDGATKLLIDAGISMRRIKTELKDLDIDINDISSVLVTHEHSDHICGIKMLMKYTDIHIYAPETVGESLMKAVPEVCGRLNRVPVGESFSLGSLTVKAFHTPHDTKESVGYKISDGSRVFALATDMGHVSNEVLSELMGVNAAVIEANHDAEMLKNGTYPYVLKKRILSDRGHMSNRLCGMLAGRLFECGATKLVLAHLSKENNTPETARETVEKWLCKSGAVPGENMELYVAPRDMHGPVLEI